MNLLSRKRHGEVERSQAAKVNFSCSVVVG